MASKATRTALKLKEAMQQYSKRMCTRVTVFWMIYRLVCLTAVFIKPDISVAVNRLTEGLDTVMIVNMGAYTANSGTEKVAIAFGKRSKLYSSDDEKSNHQDEQEDETEYHDEEEVNDGDN